MSESLISKGFKWHYPSRFAACNALLYPVISLHICSSSWQMFHGSGSSNILGPPLKPGSLLSQLHATVFRGLLPCCGLTQELPHHTRTVLIESLKQWKENPQPFTLESFRPLKPVYTTLPRSAWDGPASLNHISSLVSIPTSSVFLLKPTWQGFSQQQPPTFLFIVFMLLWQNPMTKVTYRWVHLGLWFQMGKSPPWWEVMSASSRRSGWRRMLRAHILCPIHKHREQSEHLGNSKVSWKPTTVTYFFPQGYTT